MLVAAGAAAAVLLYPATAGSAPAADDGPWCPDAVKIKGTDAADVIIGDVDNEKIDARGGDDVVRADGGDDCVKGGDGNDDIRVGMGNDKVDGGEGDDVISGRQGDDRVKGGAGNDTLREGGQSTGGGEDTFEGGSGDDQINSQDGEADEVKCGSGTDVADVDALDTVHHDCETVVVA